MNTTALIIAHPNGVVTGVTSHGRTGKWPMHPSDARLQADRAAGRPTLANGLHEAGAWADRLGIPMANRTIKRNDL